MKASMQDYVVQPQQRFAYAFSQLNNAKEEQDQSVTLFVTYITSLARKIDVFNVT